MLIGPLLVALLVLTGTASAAPGEPWVTYVANSVAKRGGQEAAVLLRTDPATGGLHEVARNGPGRRLFDHPYDIAAAPDGAGILVVDMGAFASGQVPPADGRVLRVDLVSGHVTVVSEGGELVDPAGLAVAAGGDLFVVDNVGARGAPTVLRVDAASGAQSVVSEGDLLCYPFGIAIEGDGRLVVSDFGDLVPVGGRTPVVDCPLSGGSLVRVNPAGGAQALLSANTAGSSTFLNPFGVAVEPGGGILVANQTSAVAAVSTVDPGGGLQAVLTPNASGSDAFELPQRLALTPDGDLVVSDFELDDGEGGLVKVARRSGQATVLRKGALFNNPLGVAVVANRAPAAALSISPRLVAAGRPVAFDASASSDPEGLSLRYDWDLDGDGSFETATGTAAAASRSFGSSTTLTPRVRVTDPHGGAALAAAATPLTVDGIPPRLSRLSVSRGPLRRAHPARFRFTLSEPASVRIRIERRVRSRSWRRVTTLARSVSAGPGSLRLPARVGRRPLAVGHYRALAQAADRAGNQARPRTLALRVAAR